MQEAYRLNLWVLYVQGILIHIWDDAVYWMQGSKNPLFHTYLGVPHSAGERGGSVVECRTPEEVRGSRPTAAVLCPWARHFTPRKYWLITQEAMAPPWYDWKIVDWDVKPQHNQPTKKPHSAGRVKKIILPIIRPKWNIYVVSVSYQKN